MEPCHMPRKPAHLTHAIAAVTILSWLLFDPMALALYPMNSGEFKPWQLLSYVFAHGGGLHLLLNMIVLLSFGPPLEREWGATRFLLCYALAAMLGGVMHAMTVPEPVVGASAALFGLFAAFAISNPKRKIVSLIPLPLAASYVLIVYVVLSVLAVTFGWAAGVAHMAHLGGVATGVLLALNNKPPR